MLLLIIQKRTKEIKKLGSTEVINDENWVEYKTCIMYY